MMTAPVRRVNACAEALGMDSHDELGTNSGLLRARSGRFKRAAVARWREREGLPSRPGPPSAVTPELAEEGCRLLKEGLSVEVMCERIGVAKSSWYRWVHHKARGEVQVRQYTRKRRDPKAIPASLERRMLALDKANLPRTIIAERLGLHLNTVVKYLLRHGRPRKRT
jgi:IS30 family transposase